MSLYPAPSPRHAEPTLQPSYFTSSLYIDALRQDITALVTEFREQYLASPNEQPFPVFKRVWRSQNWHLLHFRIFDDRTREVFLKSTCRVFLEHTQSHEQLFTRVTGMLAFYTFYATQPLDTTPALWNLKHVPLPYDQILELEALTESLESSEFASLQRTVTYILQYFRANNVFLVLPHSKLSPDNPRSLPRETYVDQGSVTSLDSSSSKKKGRPTKNDKTRKLKSTMDTLESWLEKTESLSTPSDGSRRTASNSPAASTLEEYSHHKTQLLQSIARQNPDSGVHAAINKANELILQRLKDVSELVPEDDAPLGEPVDAGIKRVELAIADMDKGTNSGIFNLLEGSGKKGH